MPPPERSHDAYVAHDHNDGDEVETLCRALHVRFGFRLWFDRWMCIPGASFIPAMAKGVIETETCLVCIGAHPVGGWLRQEIDLALNRHAADESRRMMAVLLPSAPAGDPVGLIPPFLSERTCVDLRTGIDDPRGMHLLEHGIRGTAPGPWPPLDSDAPEPNDNLAETVKVLQALRRVADLLDPIVVLETQRRIVARRIG